MGQLQTHPLRTLKTFDSSWLPFHRQLNGYASPGRNTRRLIFWIEKKASPKVFPRAVLELPYKGVRRIFKCAGRSYFFPTIRHSINQFKTDFRFWISQVVWSGHVFFFSGTCHTPCASYLSLRFTMLGTLLPPAPKGLNQKCEFNGTSRR